MLSSYDFSNGDKYEHTKIVIPTLGNIRYHLAVWIAAVVSQVHAGTWGKLSVFGGAGSIDVNPGAADESSINTVIAIRDVLVIIYISDIVAELSPWRDVFPCR